MTTNYGQQQIIIESQLVGTVRVSSVDVAPALAPRLRFRTDWTLTHYRPVPVANADRVEFRITSVRGELRTAEREPAVGLLVQHGDRQTLRSREYADADQLDMVLDLDWYRFERLEEIRQGKSLQLWMKLWAEVQCTDRLLEARIEPFAIRVPREDWLSVLSGITGDRTDLLEVRYHLTYASRFAPSLDELELARRAIDRGETTQAVILARKALTLMEAAVRQLGEPTFEAALTSNVGERHAKLYRGIASQIKEMGNIQAHEPNAREHSRVEALFAVRVSEMLLELTAALTHRS